MSMQLQWTCSVHKLELVFLCRLKGIERFYGKEFTAVSVTLSSVQTGADIPLPAKRNRKISWQRSHCSFSDPVQCPIWSWYSFVTWEEWKYLVAKKPLNFSGFFAVSNLKLIFLWCHRDMEIHFKHLCCGILQYYVSEEHLKLRKEIFSMYWE